MLYKAKSFCLPFSLASFSTNDLNISALGSEIEYTAWPIPYIRPFLLNASLLSIFLKYSLTSVSSFVLDTFFLMSLNISTTIILAPPWRGPFKEDRAAAIVEYVSEPDDVTTLVVKVELFPPPCSIWRTNARSKTFASKAVYFLSGLKILSKFSLVESSGFGLWIYKLLFLL